MYRDRFVFRLIMTGNLNFSPSFLFIPFSFSFSLFLVVRGVHVTGPGFHGLLS